MLSLSRSFFLLSNNSLEFAKKYNSFIYFSAFSSTLSCSYAFMLPAATPPNAIVKEAANINVVDMMKIGFIMNVICVFTTVIMINTYGRLIYYFGDELPDWLTENDPAFAQCANQTLSGF